MRRRAALLHPPPCGEGRPPVARSAKAGGVGVNKLRLHFLGVESIPGRKARDAAEAAEDAARQRSKDGPHSTGGRPGQRGGFKKRR